LSTVAVGGVEGGDGEREGKPFGEKRKWLKRITNAGF
jgi:hypothetical protein